MDNVTDADFDRLHAMVLQHGFESEWCLYSVKDFDAVPYPQVKFVQYKDYWPDNDLDRTPMVLELPIGGKATWLDIWRACDALIRQSGDTHHEYIEVLRLEGDRLILECGS